MEHNFYCFAHDMARAPVRFDRAGHEVTQVSSAFRSRDSTVGVST
jgi:hypothetical protein